MNQSQLDDILGGVIRGLRVKPAWHGWVDEVRNAGVSGVAVCLRHNPDASTKRLSASARRAMQDEMKAELRRRGATISEHGVFTRPPKFFNRIAQKQYLAADDRTPDPPAGLIADDLLQRVEQLIRTLPGLEHDVVKLVYVKGMSRRVSAAKLGISQQCLRKNEQSALKRIRNGIGLGQGV